MSSPLEPLLDPDEPIDPPAESELTFRGLTQAKIYEDLPGYAYGVAWSADGSFIAAAGGDGTLEKLKVKESAPAGEVVAWSTSINKRRVLYRPDVPKDVIGMAWHPSQNRLAFGADDGCIYISDLDVVEPGQRTLFRSAPNGAGSDIRGLAWSRDGLKLAVTEMLHSEEYENGLISVWDVRSRSQLGAASYKMHRNVPCWSPDGRVIVAPGGDGVVYVYASDSLQILKTLHGHGSETVYYVDISPDGKLVASGSYDKTVRVWDIATGKEVATLEGLNEGVGCVQFSPNGRILASKGWTSVQMWRCRDWGRVAEIPGIDVAGIGGIAFHSTLPLFGVKERVSQRIITYELDYALLEEAGVGPDSRRYVNAKTVLLGDTGVGKSGLGLVLSGQKYEPTDSTHGRRVWVLDAQEVESPKTGRQTREMLLWDLAGQPGYRLVHQLHLNEIAVALIVFDSRSEVDPFSGVKYWIRALAQARRLEETTLPRHVFLVAARADRFGIAVSRERIQEIVDTLGLDGFFETSAKEGWQVAELDAAIRSAIDWDALPMVSSTALFDSIKQFLVNEKMNRRILSTSAELYRSFVEIYSEAVDNSNLRASFETCVRQVESRDLIRRLRFGGLILLQPELLDNYAAALVQAAREEPDGLGFISENCALAGRFRLAADERMADRDQEKLLLIATIEELLRHEIALKETTDQGVDLIFPSQFTRERPDAPDIPGKQVVFEFDGSLQSIYASLAVRLAHSSLFRRQTMWQNAASYTATVGGTCGIHIRELEEGRGELTLFYDERAETVVRSQFETYVAAHLETRAIPGTINRRAIRSCPGCGYILPDDLIRGKLSLGMLSMRCPLCEKCTLPLQDEAPSTKANAAVSEMNRSADEQRDRTVASTRLRGKLQTNDYDVFLCHNSKDKPAVIALGERLKERGILPWLDIWEIRPGIRWQKELRAKIRSVKSAAILFGPRGASPWQELEVEAILGDFAKRNKPIIPVILEGRQASPRLPAFLKSWHIVDMRKSDPDPFEQLVWGITGEKPDFL